MYGDGFLHSEHIPPHGIGFPFCPQLAVCPDASSSSPVPVPVPSSVPISVLAFVLLIVVAKTNAVIPNIINTDINIIKIVCFLFFI